jgi:hypothetical protein
MNSCRLLLASIWVRAAIAIVAVLTPAVVWANPAAAVADGTAAAPGQYPFAVKLSMTHIPRLDGTYYDSACSAALISPTWIITAGHCFHDVNRVPVSGPAPYATTATLATDPAAVPARPGRWPDLLGQLSAPPGEPRFVTDVRQSTTTDIALARLSRSVTNVSPLGLSDTGPPTGAVLTIAGWGATSGFIPTPGIQLSIGQVTIQAVNPSTIAVVGSSPAADTSACLYDSGAPYFSTSPGAPPLLVSTESTGPDCPHHDAETTARVDNITEWIRTIVSDLP